MAAESKAKGSNRPAKRVLWEVRQRYKIDNPTGKPRKRSTLTKAAKPSQERSARTTPLIREPIRRRQAPARSARGGGVTPPPGSHASAPGRGGRTGKWIKRVILLLLLLALLSGGVFGYKVISASNRISTAERSLLGQLKDLLFSQGKELQGEKDGRINILLMAIGGEGHKGRNLADTIMLVSIRPEEGAVALLSIPRDLYVQVPDESYFSKINAVHAYGEQIKTDEGPEKLREVVTEITGQPIHYYGRIDFTGFKEIVDTVGGLNINIDNEFFDYWHKISFPAGTERMDGERALAFVRARYIEGPEGGDFRRAARQQQVLLALRDNVFSVNTALDFTALNNILNSLSDNIRTDMHLWEMKRFYELARTIDASSVKSAVLSTGPKGVLVGSTEILGDSPASVLKPRTGDFSEIQSLASTLFDGETSIAPPASVEEQTPEELTTQEEEGEEPEPLEKPTVEIRNGTAITGLASRTSDTLSADGYEVLAIGNAAQQNLATTTVYILDEAYTDAGRALASDIGAETDSGKPSDEEDSKAAVLVILGSDADEEPSTD